MHDETAPSGAKGEFPFITEFPEDPIIEVSLEDFAVTAGMVVQLRVPLNVNEELSKEMPLEEAEKYARFFKQAFRKHVDARIVQSCNKLLGCWLGPDLPGGGKPTLDDMVKLSIACGPAFTKLLSELGSPAVAADQERKALGNALGNFPESGQSTSEQSGPVLSA